MRGQRRSRTARSWQSAGRASCAIWQPAGRSGADPQVRRRSSVAATWSVSAITTSIPRPPLASLVTFLRPGADLLVTQGSRGGLLVIAGRDGPPETLRYLPTATDREIDPTGAGDTFLAALLASTLRPAIVGRTRARRRPDLRFAAAAGSLAVEGPGLAGVPDRAAVLVRRARERVRRAVIPSAASQVGTGGLDFD